MTKKNKPKVTIYNGGFGVVRLTKEIDCKKKGVNTHKIEGVAAQIDTSSVKIKGTDSNIGVLEQNFKYDLLNLDKLMERCIGQEIKATYTVGDKEELIEGTLLSSYGSKLLMQQGDEIEIFEASRLKLKSAVGKDLSLKPTLEWMLTSDKKGKQDVELSYLTDGISWEADYVAVLSDNEKNIDLQGWVNIRNNSGQRFEDANVKLIAGDVKRERGGVAGRARMGGYQLEAKMADVAQFEEEQLFDYHMYELQRSATVADKEEKQIGLMKADEVGSTKRYVYTGNKVGIFMGFENSKENNLGEALPAGKMKFFKADSSGQLQYIGESRIDHTAKDQEVKDLYVGNAFDINVNTKITKENSHVNIFEQTIEYKVKNAKDESVTVEIPVSMHHNRTMKLEGKVSGAELVEESAREYTMKVTVEANSENVVSLYTRDVVKR